MISGRRSIAAEGKASLHYTFAAVTGWAVPRVKWPVREVAIVDLKYPPDA
jgi:hypothetical protein